MSFSNLVTATQNYFPKLTIKYKDQSKLMKFISKLLFFDKQFMTDYSTTIGNTVYFPSEKFIKSHPVSSSVILLHEVVHLYDQKRIGQIPFMLSYLFPQILFPVFLLMLFLVTWKIMIPLAILCLLPIPAIFRMHWEKRAYLSSLYMIQIIGKRMNCSTDLQYHENIFLQYFHDSSYYYMWPFADINKQFDQAIANAQVGQRPFVDPVFNMLENLSLKV